MDMQWNTDAEKAIKKVPFFVRKKVRARVEEEACKSGKAQVSLADVNTVQKRYLTNMKSEVKGYQLDTCFGPSGCPNAIGQSQRLVAQIESLLKKADFPGFLKSKGIEALKFHHEFRVTAADCPNACSQPQIKDIGIIAALLPGVSDETCTVCKACIETCREAAISLTEGSIKPSVDFGRCLACGACIPVCPTGTLAEGLAGYRIQLGGKLGRHPQLARELPGIYDAATILKIIIASIDLYKTKSRKGERFGQILQRTDFNELIEQFKSKALQREVYAAPN
jgi:dissimilatory sulfite reductase (desulfoviridin) alpha/beta subunit